MPTEPAFDPTARLGRLSLLVGAYSPMLAVLGLRVGLSLGGIILLAFGAGGVAWWLWFLHRIVPGRQEWESELSSAEPADRDVTAYVATYLLPVLAAKPEGTAGYFAYGLAAALILMVAYRSDLGAVNPVGYLFGYRVYRVTADDAVTMVLSKYRLVRGTTWVMHETAGMAVADRQLPPVETTTGAEDR